jgi:hypothetical protein
MASTMPGRLFGEDDLIAGAATARTDAAALAPTGNYRFLKHAVLDQSQKRRALRFLRKLRCFIPAPLAPAQTGLTLRPATLRVATSPVQVVFKFTSTEFAVEKICGRIVTHTPPGTFREQ